MKQTMQAIRLTGPIEARDMKPQLVPIPEVKPGFALVKVKAFGVNESEVTSRKGQSSPDFSFPRILGIEGTGVIERVSASSKFVPGQKVITMMGGLGRSVDGPYAQYMLVEEEKLIPFESNLDWATIGAAPEMMQTAYGSLKRGLKIEENDVLLVHGGSSTVGLMAALLAQDMGATVVTTTRSEKKREQMLEMGIKNVIIDDENFADSVRDLAPQGIDKLLELVGLTVLFDDMKLVKQGGLVCFTGSLSGVWTVDNFSPFMIPGGVFLTSYDGNYTDLPSDVFTEILRKVEMGKLTIPIAHVYHGLEEVGEAHINLESGCFMGKHVVVLDE